MLRTAQFCDRNVIAPCSLFNELGLLVARRVRREVLEKRVSASEELSASVELVVLAGLPRVVVWAARMAA